MRSVWLSDFDVPGRHVLFDIDEHRLVQREAKQLSFDELRRYPLDGRFAQLDGALYAFFSHAGTNFLALPQCLLEVTSHLTLEYLCGDDGEESWILNRDVQRAHENRGTRVYTSRSQSSA